MPIRRRLQFSLASLFVATAVVAFAVNWWSLWRRAIAARQRFDEETIRFEVGLVTWRDLVGASKELLQAELAVPLVPSDRTAWLRYLDRTRHLYRKAYAHSILAMFATAEAHKEAVSSADELLKECDDVADRLGLPHINPLYDDTIDVEANGEVLSDDEAAPPAPDQPE